MIEQGDAITVLRKVDADSFDSAVTDPPYGLSFMGKRWDYSVPGVEVWEEVLRVLKPGAHLLAFAGSRTYHRMVCNIEDAGFEIRDQIMWLYGSGFPKSLNVGKAIDAQLLHGGSNSRRIKRANSDRPGEGRPRGRCNSNGIMGDVGHRDPINDNPATDSARQWEGWGTALKPAHEPIVLARKPFKGTVAANVLKYGTAALNVDGCRVGPRDRTEYGLKNARRSQGNTYGDTEGSTADFDAAKGRWPANVIHDGSADVLDRFPVTTSGAMKRRVEGYEGEGVTGMLRGASGPHNQHGDSGSAARFFYCAKASKKDRTENGEVLNGHPTVKPTDLMRYLCRLVTPAGGIILDPFMGSGSTGKAALLEGFQFYGIERESEYCEIARQRLQATMKSLEMAV